VGVVRSAESQAGLGAQQRVHAARVVAQHPAEHAVGVSLGIGPEGEVVLLRRAPEIVEHAAGLDPRQPPRRVDLEHPVHVLGEVHHHRRVAALARQAGPAAARQHRRAELPRGGHGVDHVVQVAGNHDADRNLAVV